MDQRAHHEITGSPHADQANNSRVGSPVLKPPIYPQPTGHQFEQGQMYSPHHAQPQQYQQIYHSPPQPSMLEKSPVVVTPAPIPGKIEFQTAIPVPSLSMSPAPVDCPICHQRKMTRTTPVPGNTTHAWAGILFCFTIIFAFVPYITRGTKDVQHYCGHCNAHLATWHKSGQIEVFAYA